MIRLHLTLIQGLNATLTDLEPEVAGSAAQGVLAEIGPDRSRFSTDAKQYCP